MKKIKLAVMTLTVSVKQGSEDIYCEALSNMVENELAAYLETVAQQWLAQKAPRSLFAEVKVDI